MTLLRGTAQARKCKERGKHTFWWFFSKVSELWDVCLQMGHKHILHHRTPLRVGAGHLNINCAVKPGTHVQTPEYNPVYSFNSSWRRYFSTLRCIYSALNEFTWCAVPSQNKVAGLHAASRSEGSSTGCPAGRGCALMAWCFCSAEADRITRWQNVCS